MENDVTERTTCAICLILKSYMNSFELFSFRTLILMNYIYI